MAELADAADSKSAGPRALGGSIPPPGTNPQSPQNTRLAGASSRMRCTSGADTADFASYIIVANENLSH
jgi:hypothetical protein